MVVNFFKDKGDRLRFFESGIDHTVRSALWQDIHLASVLDVFGSTELAEGTDEIVLLDTSQNPEFSNSARSWLSKCDYPHVCYEQLSVGDPGLADEERRGQVDVQNAVRLAAATIYNHLARHVTTSFVWIVEDDVILPDNAAELLLQGIDQNTASVAGPYRSRYHDGYVAWTKGHNIIKESNEGVQVVEGNGFGCVMLRSNVLNESLFTCRQPPYDFDPAFYERLKQTGFQAKLNWDGECEHLYVTPEEN